MKKNLLMNTLNKNLMKKTAVISLAGILLFSQSLTASAAAANATASSQNPHICAFSIVNPKASSLFPSYGSHKYLKGIKTYPDGHQEDAYEDCITYTTLWTGTWICACGKTNGEAHWAEITHTFCGKPKETIFK